MARKTKAATVPVHLEAPQHTGEPLLVVENLSTTFDTAAGVVRAVDDVSLTLERGKTIGIVGESGSGKTVLSRSIMSLLPKATANRYGSVRFEGREILGLSDEEMRSVWGREISMIFQDPMTSLNPVMKIGKQLTEGLRQHLGMSKDDANETGIALLSSVRIPEPDRRMNEYPHQLSGGMRQRVTIAIAMACGPKLVMADEPTTALDVTVQAQILDLLNLQQAERDMAMVLVTHDLGVVAGRTDDIAVMYGGRIVEKASTKSLFANMKMPYTEALLRSIPKLDDPPHTRLSAIGGRPPSLITPPVGCNFADRCPYAQDICREERPPMREAGPDHTYACWYPVGTPENKQALDHNVGAGLPAALAWTGDTTAAIEVS